MAPEDTFRILSDDEAAQAKAMPTSMTRRLHPRTLALLDGKVIWTASPPGAMGKPLHDRGYKVRSRQVEGGWYIWAEKVEP